MKNKKLMKYVNLSILSILLLQFLMPIATALEQTYTTTQNFTMQLNISGQNQTFNISSENNLFTYSSINNYFNISDLKTITFPRNISCSYNSTDNSNVSMLQNVLYNISKSAEIIAKDGADRVAYFTAYTSCIANLSVCSAQLNESQSKEDFEEKYRACENAKSDVATTSNQCSNDKLDLKNKYDQCEADAKNANSWKIGLLAGGGLAGYLLCYYTRVKPKKGYDSMDKEAIHYE